MFGGKQNDLLCLYVIFSPFNSTLSNIVYIYNMTVIWLFSLENLICRDYSSSSQFILLRKTDSNLVTS